MYTIFINDAAIYLIDSYNSHDEKLVVNYEDVNLATLLKTIENNECQSTYLFHEDIDYLWYEFKKQFQVIEAAGGVVFNELEQVLWIYRNDRWDLPKGKIEHKEERTTAAIREVEEECGITNLVLKDFLIPTYHIYAYKEAHVLKITYWYEMFTNSGQALVPQLEEGITEVSWLKGIEMQEAIKDTYDNIKLVFEHMHND